MAIKTELLEEIGLTKSEIKVYLALLELGSASSGPIVDKSGASSSKIYEILEKLIQKGLVSYIIKSGIKYFEAAEPQRILEYVQEKEKKLQDQTRKIEELLPELELKRKLSKYKSEATIYKGMKGLETAFKDIFQVLTKGDTNYVFVVGELDERMNQFFKRQYELRAKAGIRTKTIFSEAGRPYYESRKTTPLFEGKVIGTTTSPATINIYGHKVNIRMGTSKDVLCVVIDNKELADSFLEQFERLWDQDTIVSKGMKALIDTLKRFVDEIKPGDTFDALGTAFGVKGNEQQWAHALHEFHQYRLQKGIKARWLFRQGSMPIIEKNKQNYTLGEIKFLPYKTESPVPVAIHPYKERTLLIIQEKEPTIITINNKEVTESFHKHFESIWNQEVTVGYGFEAFEREWTSLFDELMPGESYDALGAAFGILENEAQFVNFFKKLHENRIARKIKSRLLFRPGALTVVEKYGLKNLYSKDLQYKTLPLESESPVEIFVAKERTILLVQKKEPVTITIRNKEIAESFKQHFNHLWNQEIRILHGMDGIKTVFEDILAFGECDFIGARGYFVDKAPKSYIDDWEQRAIQRGLKIRNIVDPEVKGRRITTFPFIQTKYTLTKEFSTLSVFWIYGEKVAITNWMDKEPFIIVIENKNLNRAYRQQFELLWNQRMVSFEGEAGVRAVFDDMLNYKEVYFIGGNGGIKKYFPQYWEEHNKERVKKKVVWHDLIDATRLSELFPGQKLTKVPYYQYKILPLELSSPHVIAFYGDKVANIIWRENTLVTIIEDKEIREGYQKYFEYLWKAIKR